MKVIKNLIIDTLIIESKNSISEGQIVKLDESQSINDGMINVGELDQLPIYIMTNTKAYGDVSEIETAPPSAETLKSMYNGLRETFNR